MSLSIQLTHHNSIHDAYVRIVALIIIVIVKCDAEKKSDHFMHFISIYELGKREKQNTMKREARANLHS